MRVAWRDVMVARGACASREARNLDQIVTPINSRVPFACANCVPDKSKVPRFGKQHHERHLAKTSSASSESVPKLRVRIDVEMIRREMFTVDV